MESITLYFREGPSDKVYQASIRPQDDGYLVHFAYGRRGSTLSTGSKTQTPVEYPIAKDIYNKLIREKMAKGYRPGTDAPQYTSSGISTTDSGIHCQLLNPVEATAVERMLNNHQHAMQEKLDGRRLLVQKQGGAIRGINRLGMYIALPMVRLTEAAECAENFVIDGEALGDTLYVFDLLHLNDEDLRDRPYTERHLHLMNLLAAFQHPHLRLVESIFPPAEKRLYFQQLQQKYAEGVVFKHIDAPYIPGRPNSGGGQLKYKFYETASFIVTKVNDKRSVSLILFEGEKVRPAGNVTIPPNHDVPEPGTVVECRYLYAFKESGSIYQPVYLGSRTDIRAAECTTVQLKYKAEAAS